MAQVISGQIGGQPISVLREGSSRNTGKDAQRNNIMAAKVVADVVKSALGPKAVTILVRSGTEKIGDEAERSLHDALCVIRDVVEAPVVVLRKLRFRLV